MAADGMTPPPNYWGDMPEDEFYASNGVKNKKDYFKTSNGTIFTQSFLPLEGKPKGTVCLTHGYGGDTGWLFQTFTIALARWGYAAYAADMLGHGRSDGIHGYVPDVEKVAAASLSYFKSVRDSKENKGMPAFLLGESMGGGVTLLMHFQDPKGWDGFIFSAPLFVMPEPMKPTWLQLTAFGLVRPLVDSWAIFPSNNTVSKAIHDPVKGKLIASNPRRYKGKPRVGTMIELTRMVDQISSTLMDKFDAPFLTLHGTADTLASFEGSKNIYERAASKDRTLKLYDGAYHSLVQGELDETRDFVLADIKAWLDERVDKEETNRS